MPRLHTLASQLLADLELPSVRDLGFVRDARGRRSRPPPNHLNPAKMEFLWRAAQSGKTRAIQDIIKEDSAQAEFLNIVICANIQLQVAQLAERMRRECYRAADDSDSDSVSSYGSVDSQDDRIEGDVFTWMSAGPKAKVRELADMIKEEEVRMVVCCSNKPRFRALQELLENLEKSRCFVGKIKVWVDEADASVNLWSAAGFDLTRFTKVDRVCLVSATFNSVVRRYGRIRVLPFETTHPESYVPLNECSLMTCGDGLDPLLHLATVLDNHRELCVPGMRLFTPALIERETHDNAEVLLHTHGFAVLVLNGERKEVTLPDGTRIPVKLDLRDPTKPMELSCVLPQVLRDNDILSRFPFAVTGQMCLGRGITFQSKDTGFLFDAGVLPNLPDPATAYQCVARLLGNIRGAQGFKAPTVFLSQTMRKLTLAQERIAIHIAQAVHAQGWADVGVEEIEHVLSQGRPRRAVGPAEHREVKFLTYTTEAEARGALSLLEPDYRWRTRSLNEAGFYEAAVGGPAAVNSYEHTIRTLPNLTGGKGKTTTRTMYVPCYLNPTDASTLRYVVPVPQTVSAETLAEVRAAWPEL